MHNKKFVISTHGFDMGIGGLKVLHKLCHLLNEAGQDAYVVPVNFQQPFNVYEKYNVKMVTQEILNNLDDAIVVYPESWLGNYLNAPNVVRWMIGYPYESHVSTWGPDDLWFWYEPMYKSKGYTKNLDNDLYVGEQHRDIFYDMKLPRDGSCWTLRKAQDYITPDQYAHPRESLFIPYGDVGNIVRLAKLFNTKKQFYCYDTFTYITIQSLMCGTDAIVLPNRISYEEFQAGHELNRYVAYGIDDLPRALAVRNEFEDHLIEIENNTTRQIHTFINKCYDYFK